MKEADKPGPVGRALARVVESAPARALVVGGATLADVLMHPGWGAVVSATDAAVSTAISNHVRRQSEKFLERLQENLHRLESRSQLDHERLAGMEWEIGAVKALFANAQAGSEMAELYADLLAGIVSLDAPEELDVDALLSGLSTVPPRGIALARKLYEQEQTEPAARATGLYPPNFGPDQAVYLQRLEAAGLIAPRLEGGPMGLRGGKYEPTPTLRRLIATLEEGRGKPVTEAMPGS